MDFFKLPDPDEFQDEDDDSWEDPTAPHAPVPLPYTQVVAKTDDVAILISGMYAYPDGVEIKVDTFTRGVGAEWFRGGFYPGTGDVPDDFLRVGVAYSDGRKATNLEFPWNRKKSKEAPTCGIEDHGGGGSDQHQEHSYWCWPLPTDGQFKIVFEWPGFHIAVTEITLDGAEIRQAGESSQPVWADGAGKPSHMPYDFE